MKNKPLHINSYFFCTTSFPTLSWNQSPLNFSKNKIRTKSPFKAGDDNKIYLKN